MAIESHVPTEEINIKALSLEQPERDRAFYISRILSPENINWLQQETARLFEKEKTEHEAANAEYAFEMNAALKMIDPNLAIEPEATWNILAEDVGFFKENIRDLMVLLSSAKVLFPQKYDRINVSKDKLSQQFAEHLNESFMFSDQDRGLFEASQTLWHMKIIDPTLSANIVTRQEWDKIFAIAAQSRKEYSGQSLLTHATVLKMYRPDLLELMALESKDWAFIEDSINEGISTDALDLGADLAKVKILAADRIEYTDHGPEAIFNNPSLKIAAGTLPKIKKF